MLDQKITINNKSLLTYFDDNIKNIIKSNLNSRFKILYRLFDIVIILLGLKNRY